MNNTTTYGYDAVDRLITDTNQLGKSRTRSYDNVGNLTQTTDRNGRKVAYNYDTLNRQTSERWLDSNSATIKTFSASYDAVGHLITSTNPDAAYTYSYDAVDRVSSIDNTGTVGVPAVKFNYGYDAVGNLLSVNDSINGTNAGITGYTYDLLNRVTKLTQAGTGVQTKRVDMAYNAVNQLTNLSRFSGVNGVVDTSYVYDNNQRLIKLAHVKGASTVASYDYSYDNADKLAATVSSVDGTSNYSYDATNQLTGASHTAQTNEAYSYDANGNRTSGGTVTSANNQLLSDGTYSYTYDGEGNRTKRVEIATGKITEYNWDYRNRLAGVLFKDAGGVVTKTIDYIYDGNNQRIGKRIDGAVVERYVIDRNQIALVFDGGGSQTHRYLYGTQVDQVLADEIGASTNWFLADNQGTVKDVVDGNGGLIDHVVYDSFGKVQSQSNTGYELRFGYTGREQDNETGLDYYRARYYDASNGRFISEDPIGFAAGDGNLTRYVGNSPINWVDPSGLQFVPINPITVNYPPDSIRVPSVSEYRKAFCEINFPAAGGGLSKKDARNIANELNTKYKGWLDELPACPAKEQTIKRCTDFDLDGLSRSPDYLLQVFHFSAKISYRSTPQEFRKDGKLISKIAQQCTYDSAGNLITKGPGAGTPDFAAAGNQLIALDHLKKDVKTWCALGWEEYNKTWIPNRGGILDR